MIESYGNTGIVSNEQTAFSYEISSNPREFDTFKAKKEDFTFTNNHYIIGKWRIFPYGINDNLPDIIKRIIQENSTAPGMLEKKVMMYWGKGPMLYQPAIEDNQPVKILVEDAEITAWLESFGHIEYLMKCAHDYEYMKGSFTKISRSKASRIGGASKIAKLEHIELLEARLACSIDSTDLKPTHIAITDHSLSTLDSITNMKVYPLFDVNDPFKDPTSATYTRQYSFGDKNYTTPPIVGSLEWLKRSTAIPIILKALSKNSVTVKFHVESPQEFWDAEEKRLKDNCTAMGKDYEDQMLIDYRKSFMKDLLKVLADEENTGKLWHTRKILEVRGNNVLEHGWKIIPIDQKIKDFVAAQILISQRADRAVSAGIGLHGAIGNIAESGTSDSGSEQVYAYQNFVNSGTEVPELIICKTINDAIKINWPKTKTRIGFFQATTQKQSDISPKKRLIDQS